MSDAGPLIVGVGGATRAGSSSERAVRAVLAECEARGARTRMFDGPMLAALPHYAPEGLGRSAAQAALCDAVRAADGLVIGTPGYHAGASGLVKNALDLLEDLRDDVRPYLDRRPVGLVVTAAGWQAGGVVLSALRDVVHGLRGWPTPLGVTLNTVEAPPFAADGASVDEAAARSFRLMAEQILWFAGRARADAPVEGSGHA